MPLQQIVQPIKFSTPDDVYKFLADKIFVNLPPNENSITALKNKNSALWDSTASSLRKVSDTRETLKNAQAGGGVACGFIPLIPVALPIVVIAGIQRSRTTTKFRALERVIDPAIKAGVEHFLAIQVPQMYAQVIQPSLALIDAVSDTLVKAAPVNGEGLPLENSNKVDFSSQKSALQQSSLLASSRAAAPVESSLELTPLSPPSFGSRPG